MASAAPSVCVTLLYAGSYVGGRWLLNKAAEVQEKRRSSEVEGTRLDPLTS